MTLIESTGELVSRQAMPPVDPSLPNTTKAPRILSSVGFLTGIAAVIVALRSYVRVWVLKLFGPDDYIMLIAMVRIRGFFQMHPIYEVTIVIVDS